MRKTGRPRKYMNAPMEVDGITFDSRKEGKRYIQLKSMADSGRIKELQLQVPFVLQPGFKNPLTGKKEREIKYVADFVYLMDGKRIIEDVKSDATRKDKVYRLKYKMMAYNGNPITEV